MSKDVVKQNCHKYFFSFILIIIVVITVIIITIIIIIIIIIIITIRIIIKANYILSPKYVRVVENPNANVFGKIFTSDF